MRSILTGIYSLNECCSLVGGSIKSMELEEKSFNSLLADMHVYNVDEVSSITLNSGSNKILITKFCESVLKITFKGKDK